VKQRLEGIEKRFLDLERLAGDPETLKDMNRYRDMTKELAALRPLVETFRELQKMETELGDTEHLLAEKTGDAGLRALYEEEKKTLLARKKELEAALEDMLLSEADADKDKSVIVEIRAGTGGEEAALFAGDLFRMYMKFCANRGLAIEVMSTNQTELGGLKEIIFSVAGPSAYRLLKFESGTHRVQRVPQTEASGRIHTSAVTVAVLPEAEEVEVNLEPKDLRIDVFRSSGPGGQSVNTTDSAVRITHLASGLVVQCQDEKSQHKNKAKAMRILRTRLLDKMKKEQSDAISKQRRSQVGSGDRSEKIRTYNFPDRRATDHRIGLTLYSLDEVMEGKIDSFVDALQREERARLLAEEKKA
jgi:peptide chain release factor 1